MDDELRAMMPSIDKIYNEVVAEQDAKLLTVAELIFHLKLHDQTAKVAIVTGSKEKKQYLSIRGFGVHPKDTHVLIWGETMYRHTDDYQAKTQHAKEEKNK